MLASNTNLIAHPANYTLGWLFKEQRAKNKEFDQKTKKRGVYPAVLTIYPSRGAKRFKKTKTKANVSLVALLPAQNGICQVRAFAVAI